MSEIRLGIDEIDRKYEVLEKMGEGGMGAIYKVRHRLLEEVRVIKMIRSQLREQEEHQARFLREAKVATRLRHPGIAQIYDFGIGDEGTAYIVMEFIDGTDLSEIGASGQRLPQSEVLAIADQTLAILGYLHGKRFVHRDISPDNIMLIASRKGPPQVKLIDLGIAKPLEASQQFTRTGLFVGKLKYASPEQLGAAEGKRISARSDLYAFGLVLYELLTGQFPIQGESEAAILAGHLLHPPKSFDETDPGGTVAAPLRAAVMKALEKSPDKRHRDADEFRRALVGAGPPAAAEPDEERQKTVVLDTPAVARQAVAAPAAPAPKTVQREIPGRPAAALAWSRRTWLAATAVVAVVVGGSVLWQTGLLAVLLAGADGGRGSLGERAHGRPPPPPGPQGPPGLAELDFGTYHALVIGNNQYQQLPRLESAVVDAEELARLLEERYGFRVRLLTDATRHEIITALTELTESLSGRDNLLLFYAGHGWLDDQNQSGYWQPVDAEPFNTANWISTRHEISAVLNRTPAKQVLVVADSCYAGSLTDDIPPPTGPPPIGPDHLARVRELLSRRTRLALTSGGLSPVLDQGGGRHSVFSKALLEVLGDNGRIVEVSRLFGDIESRVSRAAARFGVEQGPELAPIAQAGDEGGEFFFVPSGPAA